MQKRELFHRYPRARSIAHVELANLPTPVKRLPRLRERLGVADLWVKRDDRSGELYGGNKVRKLEFLLADARAAGHEEVWTVGGIGSHHALATCIWARHIGMTPGVIHFPQPVTKHVQRNICALSTTHPRIHLLDDVSPSNFVDHLKSWRAEHPDKYYIPAGGSSAVGVLGYVNAALELDAQITRGETPAPDVIYVAAGTCGTLAGILLGLAMAGREVRVVGVRVVDVAIANERTVMRLIDGAREILSDAGVPDVPTVDADAIRLEHAFFGPDYGVPTAEGLAARDLVASLEELSLEPTYTAKAFAALAAASPDLADRRVLYWHTLNGVDLSERVERADVDALGPRYREWVDADVEDA